MNADFFNFPQGIKNIYFFTSDQNQGNLIMFDKPKGGSLVFILASGAGGGGGNGATGTAGTNRGGGGSGSNGAITSVFMPYKYFPDRVYLRPGAGGGANTAGEATYVITNPTFSAAEPSTQILIANGGGAGGNGSGAAGGSAASIATASTTGNIPLANFGLWTSLAGVAGRIGGFTSAPVANTAIFAGTTSGTGGGGVNGSTPQAGAGFTTTLGLPSLPGGASGGGNGTNGYEVRSPLPFCFLPGTGGGSINNGTGGRGGDGSHGSGGGGGGAGTTGGAGGRGGDGFIIIVII